MYTRKILLLIWVFSWSFLKGQEDSTAHYVSLASGSMGSIEFERLKSSFEKDGVYPLVNFGWDDFGFWELQNLMRISNPLKFTGDFNPEVSSGLSAHQEYKMNRRWVNYYHTNSPYTKVRFLTTYNNGINVGFLHSQNIHQRWNVALDFSKGTSEGFFDNEEQKYDRLVLSSISHGNGGKYELKSYAFLNSQRGEENGGIASDSAFIQNTITDRSVVPVNLNTASVIFKQLSLGFDQSFLLSGSRLDSLGISRIDGGGNVSGFGHSLQYLQESFAYRDSGPLSEYYDNIFRDSLSTQDSSYFRNIENRLAYFSKSETNILELGTAYELLFWDYGFSAKFDQRVRLFADFSFTVRKACMELKADYAVFGLGSNVGFIDAKWSRYLNSGKTFIYAQGSIRRVFQALMFREYFGNHMKWENVDVPLNHIEQVKAGVKTSTEKISFGLTAGVENQNARGFYTATEGPEFLNVNSLFADVELLIKMGVFVFDNRIYLNKTNAPVPSLIARHAFYYESFWFSKALNIRIGMKAKYTDNYVSQAFSPSIGQFVLQGENPTEISFYPYLDFFVNFKVRTFELYFAAQHVTQGFFGYDYFAVPNYTLPERALRLGVNWQFSN
jgi:hypothetical protein